MKKCALLLLCVIFTAGAGLWAAEPSPGDKVVAQTASQQAGELMLQWTLTQDIPAGSWVRVRSNGLHCLQQFIIDTYRYLSQGAEQPAAIEIKNRHTREDQWANWMYYVQNPYLVAGTAEQPLAAGTVVSASGKFSPITVSGTTFHYCIETAPAWEGPWTQVSAWNVIDITAGAPAFIEAYMRSNNILHIVYFDEFNNPTRAGTRTLSVLNPADGEVLMEFTLDNMSFARVPMGAHKEIPRVIVKDTQGLECLSSCKPANLLKGYKTWFGEVHFHSEYSGDAHRPINDCLRSARDEIALDFATQGDHVMFAPPYTIEGYFDAHDRFNAPGRFVTLLGYELSTRQGHVNLYYRNREAAAAFEEAHKAFRGDPANQTPHDFNLEPLYKHFNPADVVIVPHHTNHTSGQVTAKDGMAFWYNFNWKAADDRYMRAVELIQGRGCFETEATDPEWHVMVGGYGSSIRTALAKGLRMGFIAGSDNHQGWPCRIQNKKGYCAMTAVQAKELTREAVFEALSSRRTYATSGVRIIVDFVLNDTYPMGSAAALPAMTPRTFTIRARGTAPIERAEIISQGATLAKLDTNGTADLDIVWTDERKDAPLDDCYYYLRVRQEDGHCAWSSPIWVDFDDKPKQ